MRLIIWLEPVTSSIVLKFGLFFLLFTKLLVQVAECQHVPVGMSWTISKSLSCEDEQQLGCRCETSLLKPKPRTKITCSCEQTSQIVNLYGSSDTPSVFTHEIIWSIENCSNVTVHSKVLPHGKGANFQLRFVNISALQLREDAFENSLGSATSPPLEKSVVFNECKIVRIPAKAFPSSLERIEFNNCVIGSVSSFAFKQLYMNEMVFNHTTINDMEPNAFYQDLVHWVARNSTFRRIQTNSITGGIRHMNWSCCVIETMEENSINALIGHSVFEESHFYRVDSNGLTIKEWTSLSFINNTFHRVNHSGIDLTQRSTDTEKLALIKGNIWYEPSPNFIRTGSVDSVIAAVENNTFKENCECGKTFTPMITVEGSKKWFVNELLRNSRCPISEKATECLERNDTFLYYDELDLLCEAFACMQELQPINDIFKPQLLPNRLRILAIFIGALAGAIIISLLVTMCVILIRRRPVSSKRNETSDIGKAFGGPQDFQDMYQVSTHQPPHPPQQQHQQQHQQQQQQQQHHPALLRPRSTLFEDVEMEDKGVQTMPNELSTDVLEGLREKLSRPDSFWDAKETIDHLYGLIQVREQSTNPLSSPPDVTMCNSTRFSTQKYPSTFLPPPPPPSLSASASPAHHLHHHYQQPGRPFYKTTSLSYPEKLSRYTELPTFKPTMTTMTPTHNKLTPAQTTLCEYRDPSDSQVHIYSELNNPQSNQQLQPQQQQQQHQQQQQQQLPVHSPTRSTAPNLPILCEYNEPKDVQAHVYAELTHHRQHHQPALRNEVTHHEDRTLPTTTTTSTSTSTAPKRNGFSNHSMQRPLPDIPSISKVQ